MTVASERSFSRAAEKFARTQPAVSLALQRLESELGEKLLDRSAKDVVLTDAGRAVLEYARRFQNLESELVNSMAELRDHSAGRLGSGRSTGLIDTTSNCGCAGRVWADNIAQTRVRRIAGLAIPGM